MNEKRFDQIDSTLERIVNNDLKHINQQMNKLQTSIAFLKGELVIIIPLVLAVLGVVISLLVKK